MWARRRKKIKQHIECVSKKETSFWWWAYFWFSTKHFLLDRHKKLIIVFIAVCKSHLGAAWLKFVVFWCKNIRFIYFSYQFVHIRTYKFGRIFRHIIWHLTMHMQYDIKPVMIFRYTVVSKHTLVHTKKNDSLALLSFWISLLMGKKSDREWERWQNDAFVCLCMHMKPVLITDILVGQHLR